MGCDDGAILTLSENPALAPGDHKFGIVGDLGFLGVKSLVLNENGGVVVANGGAEKTGCILGGGGHCNLEAGEVHKEGLKTLGMGGGVSAADSLLSSDYKRNFCFSAENISCFGNLIDYRIGGHKGKVHIHKLDNGAHTRTGGTESGTYKSGFGNGGVANSVCTEFIGKTSCCTENTAENLNVLAHYENLFVTTHFFGHDVSYSLNITLLAHYASASS